ncbi:hypothetical protein GWI33_006630 [Rhynchophorus ferrugineus]|uniref:Uncharacterized protein n=1 Tax=Rhynchophorus ferrugineus TaxID=354439 RepID=A0A834IAQ2_RHYFE|nr:hypothetical protein GWI33_006630 [Rhynchophorus ferrugineus]
MSLARRKKCNLKLNFRGDHGEHKTTRQYEHNNNDMHFKNHHNDVIYANSSAKDYYDSEYNPLPLPVIEINEKNEQRKLKKEPLKTSTILIFLLSVTFMGWNGDKMSTIMWLYNRMRSSSLIFRCVCY